MPDDLSKYQKALRIQREISETLNKSTDIHEMLQQTLERLLDLMELRTGWIFLLENEASYELAAHQQLPPALDNHREELMYCCDGYTDCACLQLYWEGEMKQSVHQVQCVRLEEALSNSMGETWGLTHHASIPLTIRGKKIGLLNLASPGRRSFQDDELILLETVAYQMGSAVERTRWYLEETEEEVRSMASYLVDSYAHVEKINRHISHMLNPDQLFQAVIQQIQEHLPSWPHAAIMTMEEERLVVRADSNAQATKEAIDTEQELNLAQPDFIRQAYLEQQIRQSHGGPLNFSSLKHHQALYSIAFPLFMPERPGETFGVLLLSGSTSTCEHLEIGMLEVLANHLSMAIERIRLHEEWEALLVDKERNRLARDLHDSVNQKLFALSLTSRGLQAMLEGSEAIIMEAVQDLQQLSKEALNDIRSLIWQLRPVELEQGLTASLTQYGQKIGLQLAIDAPENLQLNRSCEEVLWRVGQEALNNIRKHAETSKASILIESDSDYFTLKIMDKGFGGAVETGQTLGLTSMKERIEEVQGSIHIESEEGQGTTILVKVPLHKEGGNML